jgi:hypothetical protein
MSLDAAALLAKLADSAVDKAPEMASKGFDSLLKEGSGLIEDLKLEGEAKDGAEAVLKELEENKKPFVRLSTEAFGYVLGHFANDEEETAKNHYIATQATYAERRVWMQEGGDLAAKDKQEREESWEDVKRVLKKVVTVGLPFALKLVANGLGIPL